jgi:type IV pilus assembly protein PilB
MKKSGAAPAAPASSTPPKKTAAPSRKKTADEMSSQEQLEEKMGEIKIRDLEKIAQADAAKAGLPYVGLFGFPIAPEALSLIEREEANAKKVVCFLKLGDDLRFATTKLTPEVKDVVDRVSKEQFAKPVLYLVSERSFKAAERLYDALPEVREVIYGYRIEEADLEKFSKEITNFHDLQKKINEVSTTDIVTLMIGAAIKSNASDIHVEAEEVDVKVRFRIDGILEDVAKLAREEWKQIISRLKLLAGVKINITDVPQDGRITIYLTNEKLDIRASFLPTAYGESVVMRLLRPKALALEFEALGVRGKALRDLTREIARPNGMIITTGPTGSGKTTTLYAILKKLNTADVKIITLEDPVEYKLEGINQSQIQHDKGYTFAMGLRSILRQDPDIVMVGEIRDLETADIAIQAALTGHLVISTIHTNSAAGAIPRFVSMGVKNFLLAPALNAIIGQRLVRRLCTTCKKPVELSASLKKQVLGELKRIPETSGEKPNLDKMAFFAPPEGKNTCATCGGLGYKGQLGIYEIFAMSKEIEKAILDEKVSEVNIEEIARKEGMITMVQDGLLKALDGLTSVDEVLRAASIEVDVQDAPEPTAEISPSAIQDVVETVKKDVKKGVGKA